MMFAFVHRMGFGNACGSAQTIDRLALARDIIFGIIEPKIGDVIVRRFPVQLGVRKARMALLAKTALVLRGAEFAVGARG